MSAQSLYLQELYMLLGFFGIGACVGLLFDLFRVWRHYFKAGKTATAVQDSIFWVLAAVVVFLGIFFINSGEIRFFEFLAVAAGIFVYALTASRVIRTVLIKLSFILVRVAEFILRTALFPVRIILRIFKKPFFMALSVGKRAGRATRRRVKSIKNILFKV